MVPTLFGDAAAEPDLGHARRSGSPNAYHSSFLWDAAPPFTTASSAFETALTEEMGGRVDLDEVSLDVARYATLDMEEALVELMRKRQASWQPDLVVPIGSPAGIFVAQYRDRLFPATTPIIYTGMDQRRLPPGALQQNATFVGVIIRSSRCGGGHPSGGAGHDQYRRRDRRDTARTVLDGRASSGV